MLEGMLVGIERGYFQSEIADAAFREQELYEKGRLVRVGVNEFVNPDEEPIDILVIPPETEGRQVERGARDAAGAGRRRRPSAALDAPRRPRPRTDENLIPLLVDCARAYCTEGEIVEALRGVFGGYVEDPRF